MAAPPGREIRAGAASWPGASGLPFGFRVSSSRGPGTGQPSRGGIPLPGFQPLPSRSHTLALVGKSRLAGRDCIPDGERDKWMDLWCRGLDLWQSFKDRLGFGGPSPPPKRSPVRG